MKKQRMAEIKRKTAETDITVQLNLDGEGKSKIKTGIGFLDHMLTLFAKHGLFDLNVTARGDLEVDRHHTNEDVGICLGEAFSKALADKKGISRYGFTFVPMDESLANARVVLDISGRPSFYFKKAKNLPTACEGYSIQDAKEFFKAFTNSSGINIHLDILRGEDTHHVIEAAFKALARAMRVAVSIDKRVKGVPSTKGRL